MEMIIPAILEKSVEEVQKKIDRVRGFVDRVQIDIIDEQQTVGLRDLQNVNFYHLAVDIHLMTDDPEKFLEQCAEITRKTDRHPFNKFRIAMTSRVRAIGQIERMPDQKEFIQKAHKLGLAAGLALDLYTPILSLDFSARERVDCILLMSVKAGLAGQPFDHRVIEKIKELRDSPYRGIILMDGGEDPAHIKMSREAGATEFAVGSYLWQHEDIRKALQGLEEAEN